MKPVKSIILPILLGTVWISINEFVRNQFLLIETWRSHYFDMGLTFPEEPLNGVVWGIWALVFAVLIFVISKKFSFWQSTFLSWTFGFVMMWLVVGNMNVLPFEILNFALPWSFAEAAGACYIVSRMQQKQELS